METPSIKLSIIVLNWNVADLLATCLRSLPAACGHWWQQSEVLVVDNASTDRSVETLRRDFPYVRLLALPYNAGFSAGNNAGIRATHAPFVLLLNPDTMAEPESVATMADHMVAHEDVGIVGPRLLNPDGTLQPSRRRFPTVRTALIESTPLQRWLANASAVRRYYVLDRSDDETQEVDWLSGAALLCRREALEQAGLLDPGYFMFSEEVDLCRRVTNVGWRVLYLPQARITHFGGQSTDKDVPARHINFNSSKVRYFLKHEGRLVGQSVKLYLLGTYAAQMLSEGAKWLLGHKRSLRAERIRMYALVLRTGLSKQRRRVVTRRVLLISGEYPPARGGVGDYTCRLATALQRRRLWVRVMTRKTRGRRAAVTAKGGAPRAVDVPLSMRRVTVSGVLRAARGASAEVVHIEYQTGAYEMRPTVSFLPLLLRVRGWRGKTIVTFHDLLAPYLFPKAGPLRPCVNYLLARTASAVVATNTEDFAKLKRWGVKRLELIPIGPNILKRPPAGYDRASWREQHGIGENQLLLAYFGFLNRSKGLDSLLHAISILKSRSRRYKLMMVGGGLGSSDPTNKATAGALNNMAQELDVRDEMIWTGFLEPEQVSAALLATDIAVLPFADGASFRRGSLMAVLEHGLPIVTTRPPEQSKELSLPQRWPVLRDGENALLVEPRDTAALARAIERLADDGELRTKLARGAQELATFFSWERIAEMHARLYGE